ncbi:myosin heavy chain kinase C-like isoform X2 [Schistocerca cancellata]|uniref:myosin heavy chain kinase C-like isoform X2 n=1 Tax=Schistocerca cancellata TaxID=274614 RepID=UPI0021191D1A|nr:myosin heavy chain kinase C-like isoform X2 [Schistocerca cancellata]
MSRRPRLHQTQLPVSCTHALRPAVMVLKPPGGGSSDIFGTAPVDQSPKRRTNYMQSSLFVEPESVNTTPARVKSGEGTTTNGVKEASVTNGNDNANETTNINANVNNENTAASASAASAPAASAPAASTATSSPARAATAPQRSRVPPGGFSSGLW